MSLRQVAFVVFESFLTWGGPTVLLTAIIAAVAAGLFGALHLGNGLSAWLALWVATLWTAALILYVAGHDLRLFEERDLVPGCDGDFGCDSRFYFGNALGAFLTGALALVARRVFCMRSRRSSRLESRSIQD